jgi:hypothetical protein
MHRLAVVAMTEELHDRFGSDFDLGHAAAALDLHHSLCSGFISLSRNFLDFR